MKYLMIVFLLLSPVNAHSSDDISQDKMETEAFTAYKSKSKFNEKRMGERVQRTYNVLVKFGVFRLKKRGYDASNLQKEWNAQYSKVFLAAEIGINDIPDHEPALKWLNDFYLLLVATLGQASVNSLRLDDIDTLNRGIPVMFHPKSTDKIDYNLCFIKSSKAIGYWGTMGACSIFNSIGTNPAIVVCSPLSEGARLAFGLVADPLSDAIWEGSNASESD